MNIRKLEIKMKRWVFQYNQQKKMNNGKIIKIMDLDNLIHLMFVLTFKLIIANKRQLSNHLKYQSHLNLISNLIKIELLIIFQEILKIKLS